MTHDEDAPRKPDTPEEAAQKASAAFEAKDGELRAVLGGSNDPDPWLVADELCLQRQHEAALASADGRRALEVVEGVNGGETSLVGVRLLEGSAGAFKSAAVAAEKLRSLPRTQPKRVWSKLRTDTGAGAPFTLPATAFTRAFMMAGAPRVPCSLWRVDDEATRALMSKFYEYWDPKEGEGGGPVDGPLRVLRGREFLRRPDEG